MRYSEYLRNLSRLEKHIAACSKIEARTAAGKGALVRLLPRLRQSKIESARLKRAALCLERGRLVASYFGEVVQNVDMWAAKARGMSTSAEAIAFLKRAAAAQQRSAS
jgi:hypothetical protein